VAGSAQNDSLGEDIVKARKARAVRGAAPGHYLHQKAKMWPGKAPSGEQRIVHSKHWPTGPASKVTSAKDRLRRNLPASARKNLGGQERRGATNLFRRKQESIMSFDEMIGLSTSAPKVSETVFDKLAGLAVEDHDPQDGVKLRALVDEAVALVGECRSMKPDDAHTKKCEEIEAKLKAMKSIVEKL